MVSLMHQLYWAMMFPDIWSEINGHVSVRIFLDDTNLWIYRLNKADHPP